MPPVHVIKQERKIKDLLPLKFQPPLPWFVMVFTTKPVAVDPVPSIELTFCLKAVVGLRRPRGSVWLVIFCKAKGLVITKVYYRSLYAVKRHSLVKWDIILCVAWICVDNIIKPFLQTCFCSFENKIRFFFHNHQNVFFLILLSLFAIIDYST